jgi:type I site-specific restriction endonuclease
MYQYRLNNVYFQNTIWYLTNHRHHNHVINEFANKLKKIDKNYIKNIEIVHDEIKFQYLINTTSNKYNVPEMLTKEIDD